ncbi:MAG: 4-phosphoerythronate dehydrogenase [Bacteroidales bacterium]
MLKIVADHKIPFLKGALEGVAHVEYRPATEISNEHLKNANALIIRTRTRCNEKLLAGTNIRFIATATIGHDHIDKNYCDAHNIRWANAPGCNASSVGQYVASALAYISGRHEKPLHELTIGIIGAGNTGSMVESLTNTLGMEILLNDPPRQKKEGHKDFTDLETLLEKSDIVTLHIPLEQIPENNTFHLAGKDFFNSMKKGAWFINTSRGEVADTIAIFEAISSKHIGGTVLDVWENEPAINRELLKLSDIATPHIAGYSADGKANGTAGSVQEISRFFGLGLTDWYPENIPLPANANTSFSCRNKKRQDIFRELSLLSYNILQDSDTLKKNPNTFERQRENYPLRREPGAYDLKIFHCDDEKKKFIRELGFGVV